MVPRNTMYEYDAKYEVRSALAYSSGMFHVFSNQFADRPPYVPVDFRLAL